MHNFNRYARRAAFLLALGLGSTACDKAVDVTPQNSLNASTGFKTPQDVNAGLLGCYSTIQNTNYYGLRYQLFADMEADNARWTGTFPTFGQIAQNQILPDNVELTNMWNTIYAGINNTNYVIQQAALVTDAAFDQKNALGEARALRAFHYMNLLGYWGGSPLGYGYSDGVGVPLRLTPTTNITDGSTNPIARSSETEVVTAIRADLDYAATNIATASPAGTGKARLSKAAVLGLRARLELRLRNYQAAADFASQAITAGAPNTLETSYSTIFSQKFSQETLWELTFDPVNSNSLAFFWFPSSRGGRGEVAVATGLAAAHTAVDQRRPVNAVESSTATPTYPQNTTRKYFRISTGDDDVQMLRLGEIILIRAEAQAQLGNLPDALVQLNRIRVRAGLLPIAIGTPPTPAPVPATTVYITPTTADPTGQATLLGQILRDRRLELANEGHRWFDLRRTNTVATVLGTAAGSPYQQAFRNLWPIPQREVLNSANLVTQNPGY